VSTVLLVGAGATLAESLPSKPNRANTPPLDATFFELCERARLDRLNTVRSYMTSTYGIDPVRDGSGMEQVFNYLYADAVSPSSTAKSVEAYWALIRMYANALTVTTRDLVGRSRSGVGALIRYMWRSKARDLTIVTFNQDLVIENALEETIAMKTYSDLPWALEHCYETDFEDWWTSSVPNFTTGAQDSLRVLKLHGSLNWVYRARSAEDAKNSIRQPTGTPGCLLRRRLSTDLFARDGNRRVHLLPLIVPPIYEKSVHLRDQLQSVWNAAETAFKTATRLVVFGYSFPAADFAAIGLVRRGFIANSSLTEISVINPNPHIGGRVGELTQAPVVHSYRDLRSFLAAQGA
jgi:hypothetical protein